MEYLKTNEGTIQNSPEENAILLVAGDYEHKYVIESNFEAKYVKQFLTISDIQVPSDSKTILDEDEPKETGLFD